MFRYRMIYNTLKEDITNGVYEYGSLIPSENQLCKIFDTERATVRKALELLVTDGLIEKMPGVGSKVLRRSPEERIQIDLSTTPGVIGFFIAGDKDNEKKITEPFYADLFYFCERECRFHNSQLIYISIDPDVDVQSILSSYHFLAVIFVTKMDHTVINIVKQKGIPVVLVNELTENTTSICCDHAAGASQVMEYLHEKGHERIALITGPDGFLASDAKLSACYAAIYKYGFEVRAEWIAKGNWTFKTGYEATMHIFPEYSKEKLAELPTAIYAFNDMMALGVMKALDSLGYSVPKHISVVGHDNMTQLKYTEPDLTTVDGSTEYLAHVVVDSIYNNIFSEFTRGCNITIPVKLIERKTVANLAKYREHTSEKKTEN